MRKGLLIYNPEDYEKNKWFVQELLTKAPLHQLDLQLILRHQLVLTIENSGTFTAYGIPYPYEAGGATKPSAIRLQDLDFVINRTRDSVLGTHFEKMGCKVFNASCVTELCNHKGKTHQLVNRHGIPSVQTLLGNVHYFNPSLIPFPYPMILKSVNGHGGSEVYRLENEVSLMAHLTSLRTEDFVLQALCTRPGTDIRVFALGKEIIASVKRFCPTSFKSNYSLGGSATAYELRPHEEALVHQILSLLDFDFVGIDFILDEAGHLLFNEIEDVVGTRTLYLNYPDIDIVDRFLTYIQKH